MELKRQIREASIDTLKEKIAALKAEMSAVQESAISDTKSSMGDKYETGREMMMQEKNRLGSQLEIYLDQLATINAINGDQLHSRVKHGSLVKTDKGLFFISIPLGLLNFNEKNVFLISSGAPIAKAMEGLCEGQSISFNNQKHKILEIK